MKVGSVDIEKIFLDDENVRLHSEENLEAIKRSLKRFGQQKPIVVDSNMIVRAGNGTLLAARALGWKEIQVYISDLKGKELQAFAIADNRTAELAEWHNEYLEAQLKTFDQDLLDDTWQDFEFKEGPIEASEKDDEIPDTNDNEFGVRLGDIWKLGNHRLICGDSTDRACVDKLMDRAKADITFTSPPYNASCFGYQDGKSKYNKKNDDNKSQNEYFDFLHSFASISLEKSQYVFINNQFLSGNIHGLAKFIGHYSECLKDVFTWVKNTAPPNVNKGVFTNRFEIFLCFEKGMKKKDFPVEWQGKYNNVIEGHTAAKENITEGRHSATMPLYVIEWFIERLPFIKTIFDPFCGSGSTIIACEKTGRICYGIEIDPHYCSVIIKRWQDFTGKKAKRLSGEITGSDIERNQKIIKKI